MEGVAGLRVGYLGLGSNVGDRLRNLRAARDALVLYEVAVEAASSVYETAPQGEVTDQPDFLNAALRIRTALGPEELLDAAKGVERDLGREPGGVRHGPRPIDVDVLLLGDLEYSSDRLTLPHRRGHEPPVRARAAARARPRPGAPRRHAARAGARRRARPAGAPGGLLVTPQAGGLPWLPVVPFTEKRDRNPMDDSLELATFRGDDDPSLVAAALACRACLSGDVEWSLRVEDFEGTVECRCRSCGYVREVSLTSEQTLRLSLTHA